VVDKRRNLSYLRQVQDELHSKWKNKVIELILYVNQTFGPHWYDMIVGHDLMSQLRIHCTRPNLQSGLFHLQLKKLMQVRTRNHPSCGFC
jgi:hypothetical protein